MTPVTQRWTEHVASWRPAAEPVRVGEYDVAEIAELEAKAFVKRHHYSASYPAARFRFGLFDRRGALAGVAVFSHPSNDATLDVFRVERGAATELGRLVLVDAVPGCGESMFVAECFRQLRRAHGIRGVVSFSDPVRRETTAGAVVLPGHVGIVYQALSAVYSGCSKPDTLRLLPDGTAFHRRAQAKIRNSERGWEREVAKLQRYGAGPLLDEPPRAWLARWLPAVTRPLRHAGNHRYLWGFDRHVRRALPPPLPYPEPPTGRVAPRWGRRALEAA
jgi:hypothetical protein